MSSIKQDFKGSRLRILQMTTGTENEVVNRLNKLILSYGQVNIAHKWFPNGLSEPDEIRLGEDNYISKKYNLAHLKSEWWLKVLKCANTPNWDFVSECDVHGKKGLFLIEAKAHVGELKEKDSCQSSNKENKDKIAKAIYEANDHLNEICSGWNLTLNSHYQLSNRFAWSWKLASMGIPVILVYLGFLNTEEWPNDQFNSHEDWIKAVFKYSKDIVPKEIWNSHIKMDKATIYPIIRSTTMNFNFK